MAHNYDDFVDSLIISKKRKADKVKGSAVIGDFIIDITTGGKIVGLEIKHFSKFLKNLKMPIEVENVISADISVDYKPNSIVIWVYMKFEKGEEKRLPLLISTDTPQMAVA